MDLTALRHHFESALDHAAVLVALAEHRLSERDAAYELRPRQRLQLSDNLHLFAFHARKVIELAKLISVAEATPLAEPNDLAPKEIIDELGIETHTTKDLWFVLNRIVHSQELSIGEAEERRFGGTGSALQHQSLWTPSVFSVRSDWDSPDAQHWVEPKHLVAAFIKATTAVKDLVQFAPQPPGGASRLTSA